MKSTQGNSVETCLMNDKSSSPFLAWLLTSRRPQDFLGAQSLAQKTFGAFHEIVRCPTESPQLDPPGIKPHLCTQNYQLSFLIDA